MTVLEVLVTLALPVAIVLLGVGIGLVTVWMNRLQRQVDELILLGARAEARTWPYPLDDEGTPRHAATLPRRRDVREAR